MSASLRPKRRYARYIKYARTKAYDVIRLFAAARATALAASATGVVFTWTAGNQVTATAHGWSTGMGPVRLTTTGTLPTGRYRMTLPALKQSSQWDLVVEAGSD